MVPELSTGCELAAGDLSTGRGARALRVGLGVDGGGLEGAGWVEEKGPRGFGVICCGLGVVFRCEHLEPLGERSQLGGEGLGLDVGLEGEDVLLAL